MKALCLLIKKEWHTNKVWTVISVLLITAIGIISYLKGDDTGSMAALLSMALLATFVIFTASMSNSLYKEWGDKTYHLLSGLPLSPWMIAVSKYAYFMSCILLTGGVFSLLLFFSHPGETQLTTRMQGSPYSIIVQVVLAYYLCAAHLFFGGTVFIHGCSLGAGKHQRTFLLLAFIGTAGLVYTSGMFLLEFIDNYGREALSLAGNKASLDGIYFMPGLFIFLLGAGTVLLALGTIFFHRRAYHCLS